MNVQEQRAAMERLRKIIADGNQAIAALDPNLKPEAIRDRTTALRKDYEAKLNDVLAEMAKRRGEAQVALPRFTQEAVRRKAKFAEDAGKDAMIRLAALETLKRTPTPELLLHLDDALDSRSFALAELVRLEFITREDRTKDVAANLPSRFETKFASLVDVEAQNRHAELEEIAALPEVAVQLMREFRTGVSDPLGRMNAARVSSFGSAPYDERSAA